MLTNPGRSAEMGAEILRARQQAEADFAAQRRAYQASGEAERDRRVEEIRRAWVAELNALDEQRRQIDQKYQALLAQV